MLRCRAAQLEPEPSIDSRVRAVEAMASRHEGLLQRIVASLYASSQENAVVFERNGDIDGDINGENNGEANGENSDERSDGNDGELGDENVGFESGRGNVANRNVKRKAKDMSDATMVFSADRPRRSRGKYN
ncbi:hypothetical protein H257_09105 [Aphanomyces astaci]|uniref:Uncharacterized protein n=1 Tax=Aphanomyces astaci TaxID=112090 RepID=W4GE38_APHAT|nr:hypothetical protein H257_09105 [Aphanomyces astaci]ETV77218.1 hypothetical protein H257_09105 [Aphanomyces astaci]|eukprot:XP_009833524.1 hypothetical protein H257_09105 [Aphanomyces astaci]